MELDLFDFVLRRSAYSSTQFDPPISIDRFDDSEMISGFHLSSSHHMLRLRLSWRSIRLFVSRTLSILWPTRVYVERLFGPTDVFCLLFPCRHSSFFVYDTSAVFASEDNRKEIRRTSECVCMQNGSVIGYISLLTSHFHFPRQKCTHCCDVLWSKLIVLQFRLIHDRKVKLDHAHRL